ncbi:pickpocket protein 28-like [Bradysia coprophila]|uniref:pickpocket protein 28-like n=1 Tax=Bradysia coprophila TaxID=38358 RepID=UPI00187DC4F0|nr:pickpocket protein 28-like [Bradysia coprophila]
MFQPNKRLKVNAIRHRNLKNTQRINSLESDSKTCETTCNESFRQYLRNSTLHGLKYVGDSTITLFERIFFGLMFSVVVALSAYFITNVYDKYKSSPMIISLNSRPTDITKLPFPAVTVCNMNQALKSVVANYAVDSDEFSMIQSICAVAVDEDVKNSKTGKWSDFQKVLIDVSQSCKDMLISCNYGGFEYNCSDVFVTVLTDEGLCCTFNGVNRKFIAKPNIKSDNLDPQEFNMSQHLDKFANQWTPEMGFASDELKNHKLGYPRSTVGTGAHLGLSVILNAGISEYYCSSTSSYGFKILLHNPTEAPQISNYGTSISNGYESRVVITPALSEASATVRNMPLNVRYCLFEEENHLQYFSTYSRRNCQMECNALYFLKYCNCILYWMPRFYDDIPICGRSNDDCVDDVTNQLNAQKNSSFSCDSCMPGCFEVNYHARVSMAPLLHGAPVLAEKGLSGPNVSIAHIFYQYRFFRSEKKDELIGFTELLSNTGGLLGLFMGFSLFSFVEIFYYLSIRPYSIVASKRRRTFNRMFKKTSRIRAEQTVTPVDVKDAAHHHTDSIYP